MRRFVGILALVLLTGCNPQLSAAQDAVRYRLRDPDSAQFRNVERCGQGKGAHGDVNSKNEFGGYTGFLPFIAVDGEVAVGFDDRGFGRLQAKCYSTMNSSNTTEDDPYRNALLNELEWVNEHLDLSTPSE